ncbi:MAG: hypothetical protein ACI8WB_000135 [Phenylobacterium sp.]|jgi:hypothetical protein
MLKRWFSHITLLLLTGLLLCGCSSQEEQLKKTVDKQIASTTASVTKLETALNDGKIRNALILKQYSEMLAQQKPEMAQLAEQVGSDATTKGALYTNLSKRLDQASNNATAFASSYERLDELSSIAEAAKVSLFNDALSDPVNVLADLSGGTLARVNAMSREAEIAANGKASQSPGSQMVGNPNYGNWQSSSSGTSFWAWYGMYSMFSNVMGYNRPSYGGWSRNRGYSYHSDYGRSHYSSPKQRNKQQKLYQKTKKSFASKGKQFSSPYAKRKTGSSSLSRASNTPTKSAYSKRSSGSGSKSSYSSGNVRSGSSRTSRGSSRGK